MPSRRSNELDKANILLISAAKLFREKGIKAVSVDEIVKGVGVAKGTFYLYFKTKEDLLAKLAETVVLQMAQAAEVAGLGMDDELDCFAAAVMALQGVDRKERYLADALDHPDNAALHDLVNVSLVRQLAPALAAIVERGKAKGAFEVEDPLATLEFILAGQTALLGRGRFNWSAQEHAARLRATLILIERALGTPRGALLERLAGIE
jgi:AcrR family transcriptional regulator